MQPYDQPIDTTGDAFPVAQPVARKTQRDVGIADAPLQQTSAGIGDALARAARQEMLRRLRLEHQFLALIRRAVAKAAQREPVRPGGGGEALPLWRALA